METGQSSGNGIYIRCSWNTMHAFQVSQGLRDNELLDIFLIWKRKCQLVGNKVPSELVCLCSYAVNCPRKSFLWTILFIHSRIANWAIVSIYLHSNHFTIFISPSSNQDSAYIWLPCSVSRSRRHCRPLRHSTSIATLATVSWWTRRYELWLLLCGPH